MLHIYNADIKKKKLKYLIYKCKVNLAKSRAEVEAERR